MHPVTKLVQQWAKAQVQLLKDNWAAGNFTHQDAVASAMMNAKAIAAVEVLQLFIELDREQFSEIEDGE